MAQEVSCELSSWKEFDLSALTYPQFLRFFFDRPVVGDEEQYELFRAGIDYFVALNTRIVVGHVRQMCRDLSDLSENYSFGQIDQGLWAVFGAGISCEKFLFDSTVDHQLRIACVESMYLPFRDVVAKSNLGKTDSFYWMWWDMILHADYFSANHLFETLPSDGKQILETIHETLVKILVLDHPACQWSALHGLGHSPHPKARDVVREFLRLHREELNEEDAEWLERCSQGKIA